MVTGDQLSSTEKKRLRDRRGQKRLREKRESHIQALERQVATCKQHHGADRTGDLISVVNQLYRENEALRARHERLRAVLMDDPSSHPLSIGNVEPATLSISLPPTQQSSEPERHSDQIADLATSPSQPEAHSSDTDSGDQLSPEAWYLVPMSTTQANQIAFPGNSMWLEYPDLISACPTNPSPLDLLHGTRRNFLADQIHRSLRQRAIRDAECLAIGWQLYHFSKWLVMPDPTTFARISQYLRPIRPQLQVDHPRAIDLVFWPQVRANLLKNWTSYDFVDVMGYMSCCTKLRWPWGKPILERDEDDELQMRGDYFETFTRESAWGLTSEFIERYPELLEGMDVESIRFRLGPPNSTEQV